jgi:hypothetical protein
MIMSIKDLLESRLVMNQLGGEMDFRLINFSLSLCKFIG